MKIEWIDPFLLKHFLVIHSIFLVIMKLLSSKVGLTNHAGFMFICNHFEMFKSILVDFMKSLQHFILKVMQPLLTSSLKS